MANAVDERQKQRSEPLRLDVAPESARCVSCEQEFEESEARDR